MTQIAPTHSRLRRLFKGMLIACMLVAGLWVVVILWWQSSQRQISLQDVLLYLAVLPAVLLLGLAALQRQRARKYQKSAAANPVASAVASATPPLPNSDSGALPVLAAWSLTSVGGHLEALRMALIEKRHRPVPDAGLLDDNGYPLHAGRITNLDTGTVKQALDDIATHHTSLPPTPAESSREAFLRTLAILSQLLEQLDGHWPLAGSPADRRRATPARGILRGREPDDAPTESKLRLHVKLITPADLSPAEQQLAQSYVLEKATALRVDPCNFHVEIQAARDDATALLLAERFRNEVLCAGQPQALLLLAAESTLCPGIVERWQAEHKLFGSHVPHGLMPGEAAFAILCVNQAAMPFALAAPACMLRRVVSSRREASADCAGKPSHATLEAVIGEALAAAQLDGGDAIGDIACDADHRGSRVLECSGAMLRHTPHLDAIANRLAVNEACGHTGAASSAGGLAAGIAQARDTGHPVLVFNVSHAFERAAAVLLPAGEQTQTS